MLVVAGIAPAVLWMAGFWWWDRHDREPLKTVFGMFLLGATVVVIASVGVSTAILEALDLPATTQAEVMTLLLIAVVVVAPVVEESLKWGVGRVALRRSLHLDEPVDGMVYGTAVGLGFAATENVLYFLGFAQQLSLGVDVPVSCVGLTVDDCVIQELLPVRGLGTTLMHGLAGGFGGHAIAKVRLGAGIAYADIPGLVVAFGVHAAWNASAILMEAYPFLPWLILAAAAGAYAKVFQAHLRDSPHAVARARE